MQFQSDIMQVPVSRPYCVETTAMGAAYLAGLAVGCWKEMEELRKNWKENRICIHIWRKKYAKGS